jgi:hypothetical protein
MRRHEVLLPMSCLDAYTSSHAIAATATATLTSYTNTTAEKHLPFTYLILHPQQRAEHTILCSQKHNTTRNQKLLEIVLITALSQHNAAPLLHIHIAHFDHPPLRKVGNNAQSPLDFPCPSLYMQKENSSQFNVNLLVHMYIQQNSGLGPSVVGLLAQPTKRPFQTPKLINKVHLMKLNC